MPLITSCPECKTQFIVTKEQLKAYDGQVRCGTCNHIFNAKAHLVKPAKPRKTPVKKPKATDVPEVTQVVDAANPATVQADTEHIEITSPAHLQDALYQDIAQDIKLEPVAEMTITTPSLVQDLSLDSRFNRKPKKKFCWLYCVLSLILLLALLAQLVYFLRTEISARFPETKPWLALACQHVGCQVGLPKKIDLLTIDDSDIQEHLEFEGVLVFSTTLVNHAPFAQAFPKIELTLTNADDKPVLRRTLQAKDYLPKEAALDHGMPAKDEWHIKLSIHTGDVPVAGYRVSLSY